MKLTLWAAAAALFGLSQARADDVYALSHTKPDTYVCVPSPTSFADAVKNISVYQQANNFPQPQIDYTTGASLGMTVVHFINAATGTPMYIMFFTDHTECVAAAATLTNYCLSPNCPAECHASSPPPF
jgi:hypothetical protein